MLAPMLRAMTLFTLLTLPQAVIAGTITYDIQNYPTDQNAWTLSGAITTDGKTGVLAPSDILSWTWTITGGPLDEVRGPIPPIIVNSTDEEAVQEFPFEIHKSLPSNGLRISSLIKVVSLLARTYVKKRRILGQPPRGEKSSALTRRMPKARSVCFSEESVSETISASRPAGIPRQSQIVLMQLSSSLASELNIGLSVSARLNIPYSEAFIGSQAQEWAVLSLWSQE